MKTELLTALSAALAKQAKKTKLKPGTYEVDGVVTLAVSGTVTKGEDVPYTPTVDIPLIPTLALVLRRAGFQREAAKEILVAAMTEALTAGENGTDAIAAEIKDVEQALAHVREVTNALPKKNRAGATTVAVKVREVELAGTAAA